MILPTDVGKKLLDLRTEIEQFFIYNIEAHKLIFRPLSLEEINSIERLGEFLAEYVIHDWIIERTYLYGTLSIEQLQTSAKAGFVKVIADSISEKSIIDEESLPDIMDEKRSKIGRFDIVAQDRILSTYPSLSPSNVKKFTIDKLIEYMARTEVLLGKPINIGNKNKKGERPRPTFSHTVEEAQTIQPDDIVSADVADNPLRDIDNEFFNDM